MTAPPQSTTLATGSAAPRATAEPALRLFTAQTLQAGAELSLASGPARHAQVRRVQPGDLMALFDGSGCDWPATVLAMGKTEVRVRLGAPQPVARELPLAVTLALAMPANERMDTLVEKATELGAAAIQPLLSERSVLRLAGERAQRKREHWQAIARAACEQCGRACVPQVQPVLTLAAWLAGLPPLPAPRRGASQRLLLSLRPGASTLPALGLASEEPPFNGSLCTLSGPEGGLTPAEEGAALAAGFAAVDLGPRVLRAETAPLAVLAWLSLQAAGCTPPLAGADLPPCAASCAG